MFLNGVRKEGTLSAESGKEREENIKRRPLVNLDAGEKHLIEISGPFQREPRLLAVRDSHLVHWLSAHVCHSAAAGLYDRKPPR